MALSKSEFVISVNLFGVLITENSKILLIKNISDDNKNV